MPQPVTTFTGKGKPEDVEAWLFGFNHYFDLVDVHNNKKVALAALLLRDDALHWFRTETIRKTMPTDWEPFCNVFRARWLPTNSTQL